MRKIKRLIHIAFKEAPFYKLSTAKWGYFQFSLSWVFFFFAIFISMLSIKAGGSTMTGIVVALWIALFFGIVGFIYTIWLGFKHIGTSDDPTATKDDITNSETEIKKKLVE